MSVWVFALIFDLKNEIWFNKLNFTRNSVAFNTKNGTPNKALTRTLQTFHSWTQCDNEYWHSHERKWWIVFQYFSLPSFHRIFMLFRNCESICVLENRRKLEEKRRKKPHFAISNSEYKIIAFPLHYRLIHRARNSWKLIINIIINLILSWQLMTTNDA